MGLRGSSRATVDAVLLPLVSKTDSHNTIAVEEEAQGCGLSSNGRATCDDDDGAGGATDGPPESDLHAGSRPQVALVPEASV